MNWEGNIAGILDVRVTSFQRKRFRNYSRN